MVQVLTHALQTGETYEVESRHRRFDGVCRWFHVRGFPLKDTHGQILQWCVLLTDIEDRKQVEEALRSAERNLDQIINTIPAHIYVLNTEGAVLYVSQAVISIAHEVNQPLSGIITNASTCVRMLDAEPPNVDGARETAAVRSATGAGPPM